MYFNVILVQISILGLLTIIGAIAAKLNVITVTVKDSIASIIFNITLPFLIIISVTSIELNKQILQNSILVFIYSIIGISLLWAIGLLSKKTLKLKEKQADIHVLNTMFGNVAFLGYPLFSTLFPGGEGLLYAIIFHFSQDLFIWTVGIFIFHSSNGSSFADNLKHLINPNTIAFFIGIVLLAIGFQFPDVLFNPMNGLGNTTIYLAMLYIGAVLVQNPMKSAFKKIEIYVLVFNKMILVPIVMILLLKLFNLATGFELGTIAKTVLIMQLAMPCMTMIVVLAKKYGSDDIHATENLFLSTIFSIGSLPLIYYLVQIML
ncbi:MAG: AEC family transporter [Bacteroidales bacterium]